MAEERPATTADLQELREERQLIREGYDFLDEKRLLLAAEILRQLERYQALIEDFTELQQRADAALRAAVHYHGLDGLQVYPGREMAEADLEQDDRSFLGVTVVENRLTGELPPTPVSPVKPSPEARHCQALFGELVAQSAVISGVTGNLHRLLAEYRRTQRRARALEDVLLPEIETSLSELSARLEEQDQEEAVRVRLPHRR